MTAVIQPLKFATLAALRIFAPRSWARASSRRCSGERGLPDIDGFGGVDNDLTEARSKMPSVPGTAFLTNSTSRPADTQSRAAAGFPSHRHRPRFRDWNRPPQPLPLGAVKMPLESAIAPVLSHVRRNRNRFPLPVSLFMQPQPKETTATVIPCLMYRNAAAAIEWLCQAFGFERHAIYEGEGGTIMHAELKFGNGMVMLGSKNDGPYGRHIKQPDQLAGCETQTPCVIVADADAVYQSAKAAGAEILIDIKDESYGGRGFTCRDLEGHIWNFGTYDPWASQ